MTRYYQPLKRVSDGRFDYTTCTGGIAAYAIGYCAGPGHQDGGDAAKYHSDGHATGDEACDCYRGFLLDARLVFRDDPSHQERCAICGDWTHGRALFHGDDFERPVPLCTAHQTRESMEKALAIRDLAKKARR